MKAALGKTIGGITWFTRGTYNVLTLSRLRRSQSTVQTTETEGTGDRELNSIDGGVAVGGKQEDHTLSTWYTPPPPEYPSSIPQEDDILYSKNNVYLKCEVGTGADRQETTPTNLYDNSKSSSPAVQSLRVLKGTSPSPTPLDKVPGFLFIASRGSNYGSTLILNWAPNSSIIKCSGSINSTTVRSTAGEATCENDMTASSERSQGEEYYNASAIPSSSSAFSILTPSSSPSSSSLSTNTTATMTAAPPRTEHKCVSIDLGEMEVIRVFYHTDDSGHQVVSGEMVVSSKQTKFWVFHFQNGGLTDLIHLFRSWKYFNHQEHRESHRHTFSIFRPKLSLSELHPGEGEIKSVLTEDMWHGLFGPEGRITESTCIKKVVFFKGVSPLLRKEVWPFLLGVYDFDSTQRDREIQRLYNCRRYWAIDDRRRKLESTRTDQEGSWVVSVQQIDKDVVRTDRSHPYYRGNVEGNRRHIGTLKHILLNYLIHKPDISYCQGMTDLLAPLLASLDDVVDAFWCFEKLVEESAYFKPANNPISVEKQLEPLKLLIKQLLPWFHSYLESTENGLTLMFCHRWLLVCFKREFTEEDTLAIWEACWTNYETTSFHLFICVAVMAIYGQKAVEKQMNIDELMVFFNTLSLTMPRDLVLTQARGYLHQFCTSPSVHCTLASVMPSPFWQSPGSPRLVCGLCRGLSTSCESRELAPYSMEAMC